MRNELLGLGAVFIVACIIWLVWDHYRSEKRRRERRAAHEAAKAQGAKHRGPRQRQGEPMTTRQDVPGRFVNYDRQDVREGPETPLEAVRVPLVTEPEPEQAENPHPPPEERGNRPPSVLPHNPQAVVPAPAPDRRVQDARLESLKNQIRTLRTDLATAWQEIDRLTTVVEMQANELDIRVAPDPILREVREGPRTIGYIAQAIGITEEEANTRLNRLIYVTRQVVRHGPDPEALYMWTGMQSPMLSPAVDDIAIDGEIVTDEDSEPTDLSDLFEELKLT